MHQASLILHEGCKVHIAVGLTKTQLSGGVLLCHTKQAQHICLNALSGPPLSEVPGQFPHMQERVLAQALAD